MTTAKAMTRVTGKATTRVTGKTTTRVTAKATAKATAATEIPTSDAAASDARLTRLDRVAQLYAEITAATRAFLAALAECDRLEDWAEEGFGSCAEWLSWRLGITRNTANEKVRVARALERLPRTSEAMARGEVSFSKVRALTRVATPDNEEALLGYARAVSADGLERLVRSWREIDGEDPDARERRLHARRTFSVFPGENGLYVVRGRLTPEVAAVFMRAIEAASDALYREEGRAQEGRAQEGRAQEGGERRGVAVETGGAGDGETDPSDLDARAAARRRADAVGLVAERALAAGFGAGDAPLSGARAERYQVVLHVGAPGSGSGARSASGGGSGPRPDFALSSATLHDGTAVTAETARRLTCDAARVDVTVGGDGSVLDVGRRRRTVPSAIRRALEARDGGCRFPGCGSRFTDAHHVTHWTDGGETSLSNLVLLCRRHHRVVHEGGVRVVMDRDQQVAFFTPDGRAMPASPPSPTGAVRTAQGEARSPAASAAPLIHRNRARDIRPDADDTRPRYRSDAFIPWAVEAAAWDALDPPDAA